MSLINIPSLTNKRHQPSQEEWKELKPNIWQLYVKENKSLQRVVKLLGEKQGFVLTKRQLTRKLNKWKFRKNTRAVERQSFLRKGFLSPKESDGDIIGIKVTNTKLERWERNTTKGTVGTDTWGSSCPTSGAFNSEAALPSEFSHSQTKDSLNFEEDFPIQDALLQSPESSGMSWPFSSNSRDPGPVFLSRLFSALSIRPPVDFHSYVTQFPKPETEDSAESRYLSSTQYNDLTTGNLEGRELVLGDRRVLNSAAPRLASTSPFNEISLFSPFEPNRVASQRARNSNRLIQITIDQYQILELEERLSKLQGRLPETHPAMLAILEGLYDANNSMANYKLAEHWCRRIITIRQRTEDIYSPQSLLDQVHLMSVLNSQGKSKEAKVLYERLYPHIKRNGSFTSSVTAESLTAESLATQVQIAQALGSNEDAVNYSKQLTQLRLSTLGPYDAASLCAMTLVAESLIDLGIYDESIRILRLMLQLQERCNQFSFRRRCIGMRNLADALRRQEHYEESVMVARRSVELAEEFLGSEQHTTLLNMAELGLCLRSAGLLSESEAALRDVVARRVSIFGEDNLSAVVEMGDLGRVLLETSNYEEATMWYEKAFRGLLKASSWQHWLAVVYCRSLGHCYEMQKRYVDGIALYEEAVHGTQPSKEARPGHYCYFVHQLAECCLREGRCLEAVCKFMNILQEIHYRKLVEGLGWERTISAKLAEVYEKQGKFDDAAALYEQNIAKIHGTAGWTYGRRMYYSYRLGECYTKLERYSDALGLYSRSMEEIRSLEGPDHLAIAEIQGWIDDLSNQTSHTDKQLDLDEDTMKKMSKNLGRKRREHQINRGLPISHSTSNQETIQSHFGILVSRAWEI